MAEDLDVFPSGNTQICISIAARPGKFGITVHNAAYKALGLNFVYKALTTKNLKNTINAIKMLDIRGCSISMPFKEEVVQYLDSIDPVAENVGGVNTILNQGGYLKGFNTDVDGAREALLTINIENTEKIFILGAGGAAKAVLVALNDLGATDIYVATRSNNIDKEIFDNFVKNQIPWEKRNDFEADVMINATLIGMSPNDDLLPIQENRIIAFKKIMDVVATPPISKLVRIARERGILVADGLTMALHQAAKQFSIYTGEKAPIDFMHKAASHLLQQDGQ